MAGNNNSPKKNRDGKHSVPFWKSILTAFGSLNAFHKAQIIVAIVLTILVIIAIPIAGWFTTGKEMAVSTKINSPATLTIKAGGQQDIINFELSDIDTEDTSYKSYTEGTGANQKTFYYKDYVFCVKGKAISAYDLQLAHTTNIAFRYQIYPAVQDSTVSDADAIYYQSKNKDTTLKYRIAKVKVVNDQVVMQGTNIVYENTTDPIDGSYVNDEGNAGDRVIAFVGTSDKSKKNLTSRSYDTGDSYQSFANPVYWLKRGIPVYPEEKGDEGFVHSYVLRISWQMPDTSDETKENIDIVQNNKETDMIYITAAVS